MAYLTMRVVTFLSYIAAFKHVIGVMPAANDDNDIWVVSKNGFFRGKRHRMDPSEVQSITYGGRLAFTQCQRHFQWDRWNCPVSAFRRWNKRTNQPLNREIAYMDALISSGIVYSVTRSCSSNSSCDFNRRKREVAANAFVWDPPRGDQLRFGLSAVDKYLAKSFSGADLQALANKHNVNVGKEVVKSTTHKECKCHGMSGTCSVKSCWLRMGSFTEIADKIRQKYEKAVRLDFEGDDGGLRVGNSIPQMKGKLAEMPHDRLVYLQRSPDYCKPDPKTGWLGTLGRTCWSSHGEEKISHKQNCRRLCRKCGHTVKKTKKETSKLCHCRVMEDWKIECDNCRVVVKEYVCK